MADAVSMQSISDAELFCVEIIVKVHQLIDIILFNPNINRSESIH